MRDGTRRWLHATLLAGLSAWLLVVTPAHAQGGAEEEGFTFEEEEGFSFGEEEVQVVEQQTPVARFLQEGIQYINREDYESASIFFWRVVNEQDIAAEGLRPRAEYELAKALVEMRMRNSALVFFDRIIAAGPTHPYFEPSAPWLVTIARRLPGNPVMLRRVSAFASLFPDRIEEKYHDEMAFMLGQHYFNVGDLERALGYFQFVPDISSFHPRALFYEAITHIRLGDGFSAGETFKALLLLVEEGGSDELEELGELTRLSMARTFYSTGEYEKSIRYYEDIPQSSEYWLDALFESSWAYFQLDQFNRALGNLHSLNSPFFNDRYYAEAPILQALIFLMNCRFTEVRATLEEFDYVYPPLRTELESLMSELQTSRDYFDFLVETGEQQGRDFNPRLQQILDATLDDRSLLDALAYIDVLDRELARIDDTDPGWANSELAQFLADEIEDARASSVGDAGARVRGRMENILADLGTRQRQAEAIRIESDLLEASPRASRIRDELFFGEAVDADRGASEEEMFWDFRGEYWRDELGHYYYHVTSACREL